MGRIKVIKIDGKHYACLEDMAEDVMDQFENPPAALTNDNFRCMTRVAGWLQRLITTYERDRSGTLSNT